MDFLRKHSIYMDYHREYELAKWMEKIPKLKFKDHWEVKILPPFGGAIIRFHLETGHGFVSVYFDAYDMLGCVGEPYWEVYDGDDIERFLLNEHEEMMDYINGVLK